MATVVVGSGPAGLATAAELARHNIDVTIVEGAHAVAASWRARYDGLRLNTDRWTSSLPGMRIPRSAGTWPSRDAFVSYLERYAERFSLPIRFEVTVDRIDRADGRWRLRTSAGPIVADHVVVATGRSRTPVIPAWPGASTFRGNLIHASEYRTAEAFHDARVLIVGIGNSATEIATQLARVTKSPIAISVRNTPNLLPAQVCTVPLADPARLSERAPAGLVDRAGFALQRLTVGDLAPYGLTRAEMGIATEQRTTRMGPVIDRGFSHALKEGRIRVVPPIASFDSDSVRLAGGNRLERDVVIAATGYRPDLMPLVGHLGVLGSDGLPTVNGGNTPAGSRGLFFNGYWWPLTGQLREMGRSARRIAAAIRNSSTRQEY
jgi:putative flavoprotein involved in K+ transport